MQKHKYNKSNKIHSNKLNELENKIKILREFKIKIKIC